VVGGSDEHIWTLSGSLQTIDTGPDLFEPFLEVKLMHYSIYCYEEQKLGV